MTRTEFAKALKENNNFVNAFGMCYWTNNEQYDDYMENTDSLIIKEVNLNEDVVSILVGKWFNILGPHHYDKLDKKTEPSKKEDEFMNINLNNSEIIDCIDHIEIVESVDRYYEIDEDEKEDEDEEDLWLGTDTYVYSIWKGIEVKEK